MAEGEYNALTIRLSYIQQSGISRKNNLKCRYCCNYKSQANAMKSIYMTIISIFT